MDDFKDMFVEDSPLDRIRDTGKVPDVPDAFTTRSIHLGALDGMFNFEQIKQLKKIGDYKERRDAYSRAYPVIVPSMLDKMAELRAETPQVVLPNFALDGSPIKTDQQRPSTTGGVASGGRQNWRGYKNLVSEFTRR